MNVEDAFAKALGRRPSNTEKERLTRLRDAFGIRDNDALWIIVMVLEYYDSIYREYPADVATIIQNALEGWTTTPALKQWAEPKHRAGPVPPLPQASNLRADLHLVTVIGLCTVLAVLLGATCMAAGASMQARGKPFWVPESENTMATAVSAVLGAPAGWIVLIVLIVPAWYSSAWGWTRARDEARSAHERAIGWTTLAALAIAFAGWLMLLGKLGG